MNLKKFHLVMLFLISFLLFLIVISTHLVKAFSLKDITPLGILSSLENWVSGILKGFWAAPSSVKILPVKEKKISSGGSIRG